MKTLVIGLDSATWDVMKSLIEAGDLPNIARLVEDGASGKLRSTTPPITPPAWTSISTGVDPGKHGIYDFLEQDRETYRVTHTDYSRMSRPAIWDLLNAEGQSVGVIGYPLVYPPESVDSFFVSGIPASDDDAIAHPPEVQEYLDSIDFRIHPRVKPSQGLEEYFEEIKKLTDIQCDASIELMDRYDVDLFFTVFMAIDWAHHYLWGEEVGGRDALERIYVHMDGVVGHLLNSVDDDCHVLLLSDHGARRIEGEIHTNSLLEEWGFLRREEDKLGPVKTIRGKLLKSAWDAGSRIPSSLKNPAKRHLPERLLENMRKEGEGGQFAMHEEIDWERTRAFSYGYMGRIFVNSTKRFSEGTVPPEGVDQVVEELVGRLENLTHPGTGKDLVGKVFRGDELYSEADCERRPDVVFNPEGWGYTIYGDFDDEWVHGPRDRIGDHAPEGVFVLHGDSVEESEAELEVTDVAPLLLYLQEASILEDMEGEVHEGMFTEQFRNSHELTYRSPYGVKRMRKEQREEKVEERLKDLGYL